MNILHLLSQNHLTGSEVYAAEIIQQNLNDQEPNTFYQISNDFFVENPCQQIHMEVETHSKPAFLKSVIGLRIFLKKNNIHVIHCHSRAASKLAYYARLGLKIGMVSTIHGRQNISFSKKVLNNYGDFIISICENVKKQLTNEFRYNERFIKNIPNLFCEKRFAFIEKNYNKNNDVPLKIAIIGRTTGPKGKRTIDFIQKASIALNVLGIQYSFTIIGGNEDELKIKTSVFYKNDVYINNNLMHEYDLIIGSGRVCIEALMSGVSCIAYGETAYCGLITSDNFGEHIDTNFGDISNDFHFPETTVAQIKKDIEQYRKFEINLKELSEFATIKFGANSIYKKIKRLYESAYFYRNYPHWIPILMYHKVPDSDLDSPHKIFVNKNNFEKHLKVFKKLKLQTISFEELALFRQAKKTWEQFPKNPLILTFDDGYKDNLINADPLLKKYKMKATLYLLSSKNIDYNIWDAENNPKERCEIIAGDERQKWKTTVFSIGSHGIKHDSLLLKSSQEKYEELISAKNNLNSEFEMPIISFAYPYGDTDTSCIEQAQLAGYDYGINTDSGGLSIEEDPYSVFRVNIFPHENAFSLWKKTRKGYRKYYFRKRGK